MTIAEDKIRELEAYATAGVTVGATTAAVSLALLLAQYSFLPVDFRDNRIQWPATPGTVCILSLEITDIDVFNQVNRVYDELLKNQVDLDTESKRALYQNLWNLYT